MNPESQTKGKRINPWKLFVGSFIPNWLLARREISAGAKLCYSRLAQYSGHKAVAYPKQSTLAVELGVDERTARRYLSELEGYSLIETEQRGLTESNEYFFLEHPWMHNGNPPPVLDRTDLSGQKRANLSGPVKRRESVEENQPPIIPLQGESVSDPEQDFNSSLEAQSQQVYDAYPRKVGRPAALRQIAKAIRKHGFVTVMERTKLFAATCNAPPEYIPHPKTFFSQERFLDEPGTWVRIGLANGSSRPGLFPKRDAETEILNLQAEAQSESDVGRRLDLENQIERLEALRKA